MAERRPLVEGLKPRTEAERKAESQFDYQEKANGAAPAVTETPAAAPQPQVSRMPLTTRVRADLAHALKRASLERQLQNVQPNSVQDILEAALEPWLRANGYLS